MNKKTDQKVRLIFIKMYVVFGPHWRDWIQKTSGFSCRNACSTLCIFSSNYFGVVIVLRKLWVKIKYYFWPCLKVSVLGLSTNNNERKIFNILFGTLIFLYFSGIFGIILAYTEENGFKIFSNYVASNPAPSKYGIFPVKKTKRLLLFLQSCAGVKKKARIS